MEKARQTKIMFIVALVLSVTAMTLGFAAFSATLNISSSATVTPNSSDFKIKIYGFKSTDGILSFANKLQSGTFDSSYLSDTSNVALGGALYMTNATIDNSTMTISNMKAYFDETSTSASYLFILKNEGKYTAYIDPNDIVGDVVCEPSSDVSEVLVYDACNSMSYSSDLINYAENYAYSERFSLEPGEWVMLNVTWEYGLVLPDGNMSWTLNNMEIPFSTAP